MTTRECTVFSLLSLGTGVRENIVVIREVLPSREYHIGRGVFRVVCCDNVAPHSKVMYLKTSPVFVSLVSYTVSNLKFNVSYPRYFLRTLSFSVSVRLVRKRPSFQFYPILRGSKVLIYWTTPDFLNIIRQVWHRAILDKVNHVVPLTNVRLWSTLTNINSLVTGRTELNFRLFCFLDCRFDILTYWSFRVFFSTYFSYLRLENIHCIGKTYDPISSHPLSKTQMIIPLVYFCLHPFTDRYVLINIFMFTDDYTLWLKVHVDCQDTLQV